MGDESHEGTNLEKGKEGIKDAELGGMRKK